MKIIIIQPPLVQLNTPYPSGAYLSAYFRKLDHEVTWYDLSISLFYKIFSRDGLIKLFSLCSNKALTLADYYLDNNNDEAAFNLRRYISQKDLWINQIDTITSILRGNESTREICHQFVFSAFTPRGARMENYLSNLDHDLTTDDAFCLASLALADLADFITETFDKDVSLIIYAERVTTQESSFAHISQSADNPILKEFYLPLLHEKFDSLITNEKNTPPFLVCISVPFAGTFASALPTGRYFKQTFNNSAFVSLGGGFINTEVRDTKELRLSEYTDILSLDRGYGSYKVLFESNYINTRSPETIPPTGLYKTPLFINKFNTKKISPDSDSFIIQANEHDVELEMFENEITASLIPDYSDIDFSLYPKMIDDTNPMHRLWNDGAWMKIYLAHGCYWHRCAFCDTTLDYVRCYKKTNISELYKGLLAQAESKRIYGVHFVDEAAPPIALVQFAKENLLHNKKLSFWGNIRFEKTFTRDVADFLAAGGLIGVSGGIEIATANGLDSVNKGIKLESIVAACCAFKEAGILVHAYMIYGYWSDTVQDIIDNMETLRQFFEAGLLDSAFWHKFVLTRHSTVYQKWLDYQAKELTPKEIEQYEDPISKLHPVEPKKHSFFARNNIHFEGEDKTDEFNEPLNQALDDWMHGKNLSVPIKHYFPNKIVTPSIPKDYIAQLVKQYEMNRDSHFVTSLSEPIKQEASSIINNNMFNLNQNLFKEKQKAFWLGGKLYPKDKNKLGWFYMGEEYTAENSADLSAFRGKGLCVLPF